MSAPEFSKGMVEAVISVLESYGPPFVPRDRVRHAVEAALAAAPDYRAEAERLARVLEDLLGSLRENPSAEWFWIMPTDLDAAREALIAYAALHVEEG